MLPLRIYTVSIDNVTMTGAQDLLEINGASGKFTCLYALYFGTLEAGDAEDEGLRWRIITAYSTSGSGGTSPTPVPVLAGSSAFGGTVEINNTTPATGGSPVTRHVDTFNARAGVGIIYRPTERELIWLDPSARMVVNLPTAPADSISGSGTAYIGEFG